MFFLFNFCFIFSKNINDEYRIENIEQLFQKMDVKSNDTLYIFFINPRNCFSCQSVIVNKISSIEKIKNKYIKICCIIYLDRKIEYKKFINDNLWLRNPFYSSSKFLLDLKIEPSAVLAEFDSKFKLINQFSNEQLKKMIFR